MNWPEGGRVSGGGSSWRLLVLLRGACWCCFVMQEVCVVLLRGACLVLRRCRRCVSVGGNVCGGWEAWVGCELMISP